MPDAYNDILGNTPPPGGKAVAGIDPMLQQQDAQTVGAGKTEAGMAPELRQNNSREPVQPIAPTASISGGAVVQNPNNQPSLAGKPSEPKTLSYVEMIQRLSPYQPPTPEQLEEERKREKREKLWSAIGDGMAAMANLYFAGQSGFSNYTSKNSMSAKARERWDKLHKEREANNNRYLSLYMNARQADDSAARWQRDFDYKTQRDKAREAEEARRWQEQWEYKKGRDEIADERYAAEQEAKAAAAAQAAALNDARIKTETSRQSANYALASQRKAAAKGGGSGSSKKYTLQIGDETKEYGSVSDYNRDVEAYAEYYGIDLYVEVGNGRRKQQRRKPVAQLAAEVEKASGVTKDAPRAVDDDEWAGVDGGGEWDGVQ